MEQGKKSENSDPKWIRDLMFLYMLTITYTSFRLSNVLIVLTRDQTSRQYQRPSQNPRMHNKAFSFFSSITQIKYARQICYRLWSNLFWNPPGFHLTINNFLKKIPILSLTQRWTVFPYNLVWWWVYNSEDHLDHPCFYKKGIIFPMSHVSGTLPESKIILKNLT